MPGLFDDMSVALAEVGRIRRGEVDPATYRVHVPEAVDVKAIRKGLNLTQGDFAARFGFSTGAVRDWEQNRRKPEASARILLTVIAREPEAVRRALAPVVVR